MTTRINTAPGLSLAQALFERLAEATAAHPGVTRAAYGEGERIAHAMVRDYAVGAGLDIARDAGGTLFLTLPGQDRSRRILVGSHLDSVPHGGNYDGAAGVFAGLAAVESLRQAGVVPPVDVTVAVIRAEESNWFPHSYLGSDIALGKLPPEALDTLRRTDSGQTLAEHMRAEGFDPEAVRRGEVWLDKATTLAFFELHIEQGPRLIEANLPLGIVTGIRGSFRYRDARCLGAYAHSGATPRQARQDAVAATAELVVEMDACWAELDAAGHDLTVTVGQFMTDPTVHGFSKIAGDVRFCLDVRSQNEEILALVHEHLGHGIAEIEQNRHVRFELGQKTGSRPALMAPHLQTALKTAADTLGIPCDHMASGAGHDAANFAGAGIPSVMLFVRNQNGSHNPDEAMDMADFADGVAVFAETFRSPLPHA